MSEFITITDDGERITSKMPPCETVVEVLLSDGTICPAWYSQNVQEPGDWQFLPLEPNADDPDMMAGSLDDKIVGWRPLDLELGGQP